MDKTILRLVGAAIVAMLSLAATSMEQTPRLVSGIVVGVPSFMLMFISRRQLGKSFSVMPEAKALVTKGLYSRIQHPMYLFLDLFLAAVIVACNWPLFLLAWGAIVIVQTMQSRREEKVLSTAFGADYEAYRNRIWI